MGSYLAGRKFDRCKNKTIKFKNWYREVGSTGNTWHSKTPEGRYDTRISASLDCPKTRQNGADICSSAWEDKLSAVTELRKIAVEVTCKDCPFSSMSPEEVEEHEARRLEAQAVRVRAQNAVDFAKKQSEYIESLGMEEMKELNARVGTPTIADLPVGIKETSQ